MSKLKKQLIITKSQQVLSIWGLKIATINIVNSIKYHFCFISQISISQACLYTWAVLEYLFENRLVSKNCLKYMVKLT